MTRQSLATQTQLYVYIELHVYHVYQSYRPTNNLMLLMTDILVLAVSTAVVCLHSSIHV